jgi:hypothetical protein
MIVIVEVGVALSRPPGIDRISKVVVEATSEIEGELIACQMVCRKDVVMPVYSKIMEVE